MHCLQSPIACRSINMKVHQTLVWLNLLSFGTKDLAAPTISIQSAANHVHKNVHQHSVAISLQAFTAALCAVIVVCVSEYIY